MIFVTVGTQLHFDRMMEIVDDWSSKNNNKVFCQTGPTQLKFENCEQKNFITPLEYVDLIKNCDVVVAHAGIGSILSAMEYKKPIIIFPRKASLGEHRNEHQLATARQFESKSGIYVAYSREELISLLNQHKTFKMTGNFAPFANKVLLNSIKEFIN